MPLKPDEECAYITLASRKYYPKMRENSKSYYEKNKEEIKRKYRERYQNDPKYRAYQLEQRRSNQQKTRANQHVEEKN